MMYHPERIVGVHKDLIGVMQLVAKYRDFIVTCGLRTMDEQRKMVLKGASKTLNSRHLTGHAVDVAVLVDGKVTWVFDHYRAFNEVVQRCADGVKVPVVWGGGWTTFKDGPHFELSRKVYP